MIEISLGGVLYFSAMAATKKALGWEEERCADENDGTREGGHLEGQK